MILPVTRLLICDDLANNKLVNPTKVNHRLKSVLLRTSPDATARMPGKKAAAQKLSNSPQSPDSSQPPYCNFSQPRTYAMAIRKNNTVAAIKIRSNICTLLPALRTAFLRTARPNRSLFPANVYPEGEQVVFDQAIFLHWHKDAKRFAPICSCLLLVCTR